MNLRLGAIAVLVLASGCQDEGIRTALVPKARASAVRTLAVLIPRDDATWFLKLSGPADSVAEDEAAFRQFVESVRFGGGDKPITWSTPAKWATGPANPQRFATLRTASGIDATIVKLGPEARELSSNVNRWRGQIGLPPVPATEVEKTTRSLSINGIQTSFVDLLNPGPEPQPLVKQPTTSPRPQIPASRLTYKVPANWEEILPEGFRAAAFRIGGGDKKAEVTIIPLAGQAGSLSANVNRWRGELGLPETSEEAIRSSSTNLDVNGQPSPYVDLISADKKQRTLAVIVAHPSRTWFVKLRGSAELVAENREAFEAFVRSINFPEGAKDG